MPSSRRLGSRTCASTSVAIFAKVVEPFVLLLLSQTVLWAVISVVLADRWDEAWWSLRTNAIVGFNTCSTLAVDLDYSWFVLASDSIWVLIALLSMVLRYLKALLILWVLLATRCSANWSSHRVFFITGSLTLVAFFLDHELVCLSSFLAVNLDILLVLSLELCMRIVEAPQLLFALVWCQLGVIVPLGQNSWDRNASTWINFTLGNQLICCWALRMRWMSSLVVCISTTMWAIASNAWYLV